MRRWTVIVDSEDQKIITMQIPEDIPVTLFYSGPTTVVFLCRKMNIPIGTPPVLTMPSVLVTQYAKLSCPVFSRLTNYEVFATPSRQMSIVPYTEFQTRAVGQPLYIR